MILYEHKKTINYLAVCFLSCAVRFLLMEKRLRKESRATKDKLNKTDNLDDVVRPIKKDVNQRN